MAIRSSGGFSGGTITSAISGAGGTVTINGLLVLPSGAVLFGGNGISVQQGAGSPEGSVTANPGSMYHSTNGNIYRKSTGTGSTGWVAM